MLYGPAISQSDCKTPGPYQLPNSEKGDYLRWVKSLSKKSLIEIFDDVIANQE